MEFHEYISFSFEFNIIKLLLRDLDLPKKCPLKEYFDLKDQTIKFILYFFTLVLKTLINFDFIWLS